MAGPAAPGGRPLVLAICRRSILTWHLRGGRLEKRKAGQGGNGEPPPLAGLPLRVGSPWRVSVTRISLPILVFTSALEGSEVAQGCAELQCASYRRVLSISLSSRNDCLQDCFQCWHFRSTFDLEIYFRTLAFFASIGR